MISEQTGTHIMPDGTVMSNSDMQKTYTIKDYVPLISIILFIIGLSIVLTHFFTPNSSVEMDMSMMMNHANNGSMPHSTWAMSFMDNLMGTWFLIFALFKLTDLKGFASGYSSYDIIAKRFNTWGYIYPFIEITLGIAYLTRFNPLITNITTLIILSLATIGVVQSMMKKSKIQCSCLGTVLKVPLTKVTLIENLVMAGMALLMLVIMK